MRIFVSKSFDIADRDVNSYFERVMKAVGLQIATAEEFTGEPIPLRVERILSDCDFLVGIYVIRYEDTEKKKIITSQWLMRETFTAHGQGKQFIALVEDGVSDIGGLNIDRELIFFKRGDAISMQEATIKFLQALRWYGLIVSFRHVCVTGCRVCWYNLPSL
jgi:hypothetical protein